MLIRRFALASAFSALIALPLLTQAAAPALDDPNTVTTVMQFSLKAGAKREDLEKRMASIRDFIRKQPGYIENALMENRNGDAKPQFVGVSRWASFKNWEDMWNKPEFQKLIKEVGDVGDINPGTFSPVKRK